MLGDTIDAETAERYGLTYRVVPAERLADETQVLARRLADGPTLSLARIKEAMNRADDNDLSAQLDLERDFQRELGRSEDYREGVAAFLAKRKPVFKGQ